MTWRKDPDDLLMPFLLKKAIWKDSILLPSNQFAYAKIVDLCCRINHPLPLVSANLWILQIRNLPFAFSVGLLGDWEYLKCFFLLAMVVLPHLGLILCLLGDLLSLLLMSKNP